MRVVKARVEPLLGAQVITRTKLFYGRGADAAHDRPAHVRAGSALARLGETTLAVVQDDASFIAILEGVGGPPGSSLVVRDVPLPTADGIRLFDDERGNKKAKLDLEACLALDDGARLVAFGSGSSEVRERIVLVERPAATDPVVTVVEARALYAAMREDRLAFSGSELNIEGAALAGEDIILLQRGNGAPIGGREPVDASARIDRRALIAYVDGLRGLHDVSPCPPLRDVVHWNLGDALGTRLTFTDGATLRGSGAWTGFLACAEASPDATRDGPVSGVAIGRLDDRSCLAELAPIIDERGQPLVDKAEGLAFDNVDPRRAWLVVDRDDPFAPAELLELHLGRGWT